MWLITAEGVIIQSITNDYGFPTMTEYLTLYMVQSRTHLTDFLCLLYSW